MAEKTKQELDHEYRMKQLEIKETIRKEKEAKKEAQEKKREELRREKELAAEKRRQERREDHQKRREEGAGSRDKAADFWVGVGNATVEVLKKNLTPPNKRED